MVNEVIFHQYLDENVEAKYKLINSFISFLVVALLLGSIFFLPPFLGEIQQKIFNPGNEILINYESKMLFILTAIFTAVITGFLMSALIRSLKKEAFRILEIQAITKLNSFGIDNYLFYKLYKILLFIIFLLAMVLFLVITSLAMDDYIKLNDHGISINKLFEFKERHYSWDLIKKAEIVLEERTSGNNINLEPKFKVIFLDHEQIDLWGGGGLFSQSGEDVIKIIKYFKDQSKVKLSYEVPDERKRQMMDNYTAQTKKTILDVYSFLKNKQVEAIL